MTPEQYLQDTEDGICKSLITQVPSSSKGGYILGQPWFKTVAVTLNYATDYIEIWHLDGVSDLLAAGDEKVVFQINEVLPIE